MVNGELDHGHSYFAGTPTSPSQPKRQRAEHMHDNVLREVGIE
jgi:hypothetical protein